MNVFSLFSAPAAAAATVTVTVTVAVTVTVTVAVAVTLLSLHFDAGANQHIEDFEAAHKAYDRVVVVWEQVQKRTRVVDRTSAFLDFQLVVAQALADQGAAMQVNEQREQALVKYAASLGGCSGSVRFRV